MGWLAPTLLAGKGEKTLRQSWEYPEAYMITDGYPSQEYLLIENRQPGSFDALLPRGGLAIWHIDEFMALEGNANEGFPGQPGWPANNLHCELTIHTFTRPFDIFLHNVTCLDHVALLQADGRYDLELGRNSGDYSDFFRYDIFGGVDFLFPSFESPLFGPFPNTDSYAQGFVARTNTFISGISGKQVRRG